ncbi:hypothetical protein F5882DRAFT_385254 [Hyaloscypha sp. PMI_1271]|nr:hypothetical protein F5882DRAFT_385254 [Hyaloscypha sp. PMI_1271]
MDVRFPTLDELPEKACSGVNRSTVQAYAETLPVGWQFSAGPSMPKWPQRSNDFISNSLGVSISDSGFMGGSTWDFSDDALWNAGVWENWDLELAAATAPTSDFPASVSSGDDSFLPNHFPQPQPANNWGCEDFVTATTESSEKFDVNLKGSNTFAGKQRAYEPSQSSERPPGRRSDLLLRTSGPVVNTTPGTISLGRMQQGQDNKITNHGKSESTAVSQFITSPRSPDRLEPTSRDASQQSEEGTPPPPQPKDRRYHKDTERQYRLRLNERFSALLQALPDEIVESASGHSGRSKAEKALTKVEILTLAKSYIASLEQTHVELEEESLVLRGQQELFKRLCGGWMD